MTIIVSGAEKEVTDGLTVAELLEQAQVKSPQYVTVSINDEFIKSESFQSRQLKAGDSVEFLYFMGGGA